MAKKSGKSKGRKPVPATTRKSATAKNTARAGARKTKAARRKPAARKAAPARKTAKSRTSKATAARKRTAARRPAAGSRASSAARKSARKTGRATTARKTGKAASRKTAKPVARARSTAKAAAPKSRARSTSRATRRGGAGREATLAQTPATGRSVKGPINPMPTRRSTGTAAGAGDVRKAPGLERERRRLRELEEETHGAPSSLNFERRPSAARSGSQEMAEARRDHPEVSPDITAGDVDASWEDAYSVGDEAPGGDNPTPDQDRVDDIGKALGVQYEDNEELKAVDKIAERDRHRWELDPASSEDYPDRGRRGGDEDE